MALYKLSKVILLFIFQAEVSTKGEEIAVYILKCHSEVGPCHEAALTNSKIWVLIKRTEHFVVFFYCGWGRGFGIVLPEA